MPTILSKGLMNNQDGIATSNSTTMTAAIARDDFVLFAISAAAVTRFEPGA